METTAERLFDPAETARTLRAPDGRLLMATVEREEGCVVHMPPTATFLLQAGDPARIVVQPGQDVDGLLEHRLVSAAACNSLSMRGDVVLHASAVEIGGEAVIFCGETGRGKSSLAHALGDLGHAVLSEDGIAISLAGTGPDRLPCATMKSAARTARTHQAPARCPTQPALLAVEALSSWVGAVGSRTVEPLHGARGLVLDVRLRVHTGGPRRLLLRR